MKSSYIFSLTMALSLVSAHGVAKGLAGGEPLLNTGSPKTYLSSPLSAMRDTYVGSLSIPGTMDDISYIRPSSISKRSEPDSSEMYVFTIGLSKGTFVSQMWKPDVKNDHFVEVPTDIRKNFAAIVDSSYYDSKSQLMYACGFKLAEKTNKALKEDEFKLGVVVLKKSIDGGFDQVHFIGITPSVSSDYTTCAGVTVKGHYLFTAVHSVSAPDEGLKNDDSSTAVYAARIDRDYLDFPDEMTPIVTYGELRPKLAPIPILGYIGNVDLDKSLSSVKDGVIRISLASHIIETEESRGIGYHGGVIYDIELHQPEDPSQPLEFYSTRVSYTQIGLDYEPSSWVKSIMPSCDGSFIVLTGLGLFKERFDGRGMPVEIIRLNGKDFEENYIGIGGYGKDRFGKTGNPTFWIIPSAPYEPEIENNEIREYYFTESYRAENN